MHTRHLHPILFLSLVKPFPTYSSFQTYLREFLLWEAFPHFSRVISSSRDPQHHYFYQKVICHMGLFICDHFCFLVFLPPIPTPNYAMGSLRSEPSCHSSVSLEHSPGPASHRKVQKISKGTISDCPLLLGPSLLSSNPTKQEEKHS